MVWMDSKVRHWLLVPVFLVSVPVAAHAADCTSLAGLMPGPLQVEGLFSEVPDKIGATRAEANYLLTLEKAADEAVLKPLSSDVPLNSNT